MAVAGEERCLPSPLPRLAIFFLFLFSYFGVCYLQKGFPL